VLFLAVAATGGCAHRQIAETPLRYITYPSGLKTETVYVLLPGIRDHAKAFDRWGFIQAFQRRHTTADLIAANAHVGYYTEGVLLRRLHDDVIAPLAARYRRIVLIGVSMGGYGAIRYAMTYPGTIDTVVLFSPFLGAGPFMRRLADAGDEDFHQTWTWLHGPEHPRIILGYGHEDGFNLTNHRLAKLLPPVDVFAVTGTHLWRTWRRLLEEMLDRGLL
jgi:pimeloyl-ACP methyl ester carboxylesterase